MREIALENSLRCQDQKYSDAVVLGRELVEGLTHAASCMWCQWWCEVAGARCTYEMTLRAVGCI